MEMSENKLILDVETANETDCALTYDVGGWFVDPNFNVLDSFSFVVRDLFVYERELVKNAYYAAKIPEYVQDLQADRRKMVDFMTMRSHILNKMSQYNCNTVCAYNANFDRNALNNTLRYLTKSKYRWFFPFGTNFVCIWNMACNTICQTSEYKTFAETNYLFSNHGKNYRATAETVYQFLTQNPNFCEEHKGLDDVKIETEIMQKCLEYGGEPLTISRGCWQKVKRGALALR